MSATSSSVGQTEDLRIRLLTLHRNLEARIGAAPPVDGVERGVSLALPSAVEG
jgi:hypothetical protein